MNGWDPKLSREEMREHLEESARARWGEERLPALRQALALAAEALWLVAQQMLDPVEEVPDFLAGGLEPHA